MLHVNNIVRLLKYNESGDVTHDILRFLYGLRLLDKDYLKWFAQSVIKMF